MKWNENSEFSVYGLTRVFHWAETVDCVGEPHYITEAAAQCSATETPLNHGRELRKRYP